MKKLIFALLLCLFTTNVFCKDYTGRDWLNFSDIARTYYIIGFSNCYSEMIAGMQISFEDVLTEFVKATSKEKIDKKAIKEASIDIAKSHDQYPYGYNYGEIVDFTNKFFLNPQYKVLNLNAVLLFIIFPALKNSWSQDQIDKTALSLLKMTKAERESSKEETKDDVVEYSSSRSNIGYCNP